MMRKSNYIRVKSEKLLTMFMFFEKSFWKSNFYNYLRNLETKVCIHTYTGCIIFRIVH
jgi:hypothetical protein